MKLVDTTITISELREMSNKMFGGLVKAVVDIEKKVMVVDGQMHADEEKLLLDEGSSQQALWGINIYPDEKENFIEFDSMINIRPSQNNFSRSISDQKIQKKILEIVNYLIQP